MTTMVGVFLVRRTARIESVKVPGLSLEMKGSE